jgi:hypothetical protein
MSQLRTLLIERLPRDLKFIGELSSITYLTISTCSLNELWLILHRALRLKYLNLQRIRESHKNIMSKLAHDATNRPARYLKQLIMVNFECGFDNLIQILKRTPNLKSLIISSDGDMNI